MFLDVDAGYTVDDYMNAPAYGGVAALDVQAGEDEHDASCVLGNNPTYEHVARPRQQRHLETRQHHLGGPSPVSRSLV